MNENSTVLHDFAILFGLLAVGTSGRNKRFFCVPEMIWLLLVLLDKKDVSLLGFQLSKKEARKYGIDTTKSTDLSVMKTVYSEHGSSIFLKCQVEVSKDIIEKWINRLSALTSKYPIEESILKKVKFQDGQNLVGDEHSWMAAIGSNQFWGLFNNQHFHIFSAYFMENLGFDSLKDTLTPGRTLWIQVAPGERAGKSSDWFGGQRVMTREEKIQNELQVAGIQLLEFAYDEFKKKPKQYSKLTRNYRPLLEFFELLRNPCVYKHLKELEIVCIKHETHNQRLTREDLELLLEGKPIHKNFLIERMYFELAQIISDAGYNPEYSVPLYIYISMGRERFGSVLFFLDSLTEPFKIQLLDGRPVIYIREKVSPKKLEKLTGIDSDTNEHVLGQVKNLREPKSSKNFLRDLGWFLEKYGEGRTFADLSGVRKSDNLDPKITKAVERIKFDFFPWLNMSKV